MVKEKKSLFKKISILILLIITGYLSFKCIEKNINTYDCDCSDFSSPSELALKEYEYRKLQWSQEEAMPDEFSGLRYAGLLGMFNLGYKYTHGALEGGLKCTSFIDAIFIKSGRKMPTRRFNSIYGTQNFYNLDGIDEYFEYVDEKNLQKNDIVIGYGNPGHIGIILDPKTKTHISTNSISGIEIDVDYFSYTRITYDKETDSYVHKKPRFLRYKGCFCRTN